MFDIDRLLKDIGVLGTYQMRILLASTAWIGAAWHMRIMQFQNVPPPHSCGLPDNFWQSSNLHQQDYDVIPQDCSVLLNHTSDAVGSLTIPCLSNGTFFTYDQSFGTTMVSEFDLTCVKSKGSMPPSKLAGLLYKLGLIIGVIFLPMFADFFGRRWTYLVSTWMVVPFALGLYFVKTFNQFIALRFLTGFFMAGAVASSWSLTCEIVHSSWRDFAVVAGSLWAVGSLILGIIAYYVRHWRTLQLFISIPLLANFLQYWTLRESLFWLAAKGKRDELEAEVERAGVMNQRKVKLEEYFVKSSEEDRAEMGLGTSLRRFVSNTSLVMRGLIMCYCFFIVSFVYVGITMSGRALSKDRFHSYFMMEAVQLPAYFAVGVGMSVFGRRRTYCFFHLLAGTIFVVMPFFYSQKFYSKNAHVSRLGMLIFMTGKLAVTAAYMGTYLYAVELYPTTIRTWGLAMCCLGGKLGGFIAQWLLPRPLKPHFYGFLSLVVALLTFFFLPETVNMKLPNYPSEMCSELPDHTRRIFDWCRERVGGGSTRSGSSITSKDSKDLKIEKNEVLNVNA